MALHVTSAQPADAPATGEARFRFNRGDTANYAAVRDALRDMSGEPFLTVETALRLALAVTRRAVETGLLPGVLQTPPDLRG